MAQIFHPFLSLPLTLQSDILNLALPQSPLLTSAFWRKADEESAASYYKLCLPTTESFRTLQNIASLQHPLLTFLPIKLTHTEPLPRRSISGASSDPAAPITSTIFLRRDVDILYLPLHEGVTLDVPDFLDREENQKIKKLAITLGDFKTLEQTQNIGWWRNSASYWELILGLKELEVLFVIGGDEPKRVQLPWRPYPKVRPSSEWAEFGRLAYGVWTGSEEVKLVGLGEGTFQSVAPGWGGTRGEGDGGSYQEADTIKEVEEKWRVVVEKEKMKDGMAGWNAPRLEGWEVKCKMDDSVPLQQ